MSLQRICDFADCEDPASFHVGVWSEDGQRLDDDADVCGSEHARGMVEAWLFELADVGEEATR